MGDKSFAIVSDREEEKDVQKLLTNGNGNTPVALSAIGVGLLSLAAMLGVRMWRGLQSSTETDMSVNMAPVMEMKSQGSDINGAAPLETPHLGTETSRRVGWGQLASENFQKSLPHILCAATATGQETVPGSKYRVAVIGGGPSGSCAAEILAQEPNIDTYIIERKMDNAKPCGGAIPLCMVDEFDLPADVIDRKVRKMKMISPSNVEVDIGSTLKDDEYIGMCRREVMDGYLRDRAIEYGAIPINALVTKVEAPTTEGGRYKIIYNKLDTGVSARKAPEETLEVDVVIGADGANSRVAKTIDAGEYNYAIAFQERIKISDEKMEFYDELAEMYVGDDVSPDFYGWVFPKYDHVGVGTGTVVNRPGIKMYQDAMRERAGDKIAGGKVIKVEAHPIPEHYRPRRLKDRAMLVGDAAGYVTKCSGEGIYFAAKSGRMAGQAVVKAMEGGSRLPTQDDFEKLYIKEYDKLYFPTYTVLDILQKVFYTNNAAREAFVDMCRSEYVQDVTFQSYLYKRIVKPNPVEDIKLLFGTWASLLRGRAIAKPDAVFSNPIESKQRL
jgi:geranylgeranyl reductase